MIPRSGWLKWASSTLVILTYLTSLQMIMPVQAEECDLRRMKDFFRGCKPSNFRNQNGSDIVNGHPQRENAAIVILCRNGDLKDIVKTMDELESRFNHRFHYPYVFLNDLSFTTDFINTVANHTTSRIDFDIIPYEDWSVPSWVDLPRMKQCMEDMEAKLVPYSKVLSYRHMCRYNSGFFFKQKLLESYDYYWRVEPGVQYFCDMEDPFKKLRETGSVYGWVLSVPEYKDAIPTLFETAMRFKDEHPELIHPNSMLQQFMLTNGEGDFIDHYNGCHFWSNFEVGSLKFWRSEAYTKFFEYLDRTGGFFYERWGDAPVHSLALAMFADASKIHYFNDIGYHHPNFGHCPSDPTLRRQRNCSCDPLEGIDWEYQSCTRKLVTPSEVGTSVDHIKQRLRHTYAVKNITGMFLPAGARINAKGDGSILAQGLVSPLPENRCWMV